MIINLPPDSVATAIATINEAGVRIANTLEQELSLVIATVAPISAEFWSDPRIGLGGAALLQKLSQHVQLVGQHYPEAMNSTLMSAGNGLSPNQDGTVTYTSPVPTPPNPEPEGGSE